MRLFSYKNEHFFQIIDNNSSTFALTKLHKILQNLKSDKGKELFKFESFSICRFRVMGLCSLKNNIFFILHANLSLL
jgi:hypothetical protein